MKGIIFGTLAASGPVALLGALLKEKTHHRQLGAVTFAIAALLVIAIGVAAARPATSPSSPRWIRTGVAVMACLSAAIGMVLAL
jgi:hypothetical protein